MTDTDLASPVDVGLGIILHKDQVLICRRPAEVPLGGYWEFPGGKRQAGESIEACVVREVAEELGITVVPMAMLEVVEHEYAHARVRLYPVLCQHASGEPNPLAASEWRWVFRSRLAEHHFPPANAPIVRQLIAATNLK